MDEMFEEKASARGLAQRDVTPNKPGAGGSSPGMRRGNLERLLRYWRPIMLKDGGFRRCRVILANHPELYPLENICAWLHHETTGLWPNEGCHHPTMKNCRNKLKKLKKNEWTGREFAARLNRPINPPNARLASMSPGKSLDDDMFFSTKNWREIEDTRPVVTNDDFVHGMLVMKDFIEMEPEFASYLRDNSNWEHVGEDEDGNEISVDFDPNVKGCCG